MKTPRFFLTGVVFAIAASAASNDQLAEERYRMKYGRYTPAEEARREAVAAGRKDTVEYVGQACCRHMPHDTALAVKPSANEAWFRAKFGRNTPAYAAGKKAVEVQVAAHVAKCAEVGRCPLTTVNKATDTTRVARNLTENEARLQMKYGRTFGADERRRVTPAAAEERPLLAATEHSPCTEACCKQGE